MKMAKAWILILLAALTAIASAGCSHVDKTNVEEVITSELNLLKNLDSDTVHKYVAYEELFPDIEEDADLSEEVNEVFSLFFRDFDYKILDIDVGPDKTSATASLKLFTIDTEALARDYDIMHLKDAILYAAGSSSGEKDPDSLESRYLILNELLKNNEYETVETDCSMELKATGTEDNEWEVIRTHELENCLVGGLMTHLSDSDLLSPEETLNIYLETLKSMDLEQMSNYLGVESLLNTSDEAKSSIASALVEQVHKNFDFTITGSEVESYSAAVETELTTFDSTAILDAYQKELDEYLASPDAVIDGAQKRYNHSLELLLKHIENNSETVTVPVTFHLFNDGVSWKLTDESHSLSTGIFGDLASAPENDSSAEYSEEESDETYEEDDSYEDSSYEDDSYDGESSYEEE